MQTSKLPATSKLSVANSNALNIKQIIESQKTQQNKIRKVSGNNRLMMMAAENTVKTSKDKTKKSILGVATLGAGTQVGGATNLMKNSYVAQNSAEASFLKLKVKRNNKGATAAIPSMNRGEYFNTDVIPSGSEIYRNFNEDTTTNSLIQRKGYNIDDELKVEEYTTSQSPKYHDEYHMLGGMMAGTDIQNLDYDQDYQDYDQGGDVKVPAFLGRGSLDPKDKNQFYMTQIINQSRQATQQHHYHHSNSNVGSKQPNSLVNSNLKLPRNKLINQNQKKTPQPMNKSQLIKNQVNKQISPLLPINNQEANHYHYNQGFTANDFGNCRGLSSSNNYNKSKNRVNLNTSALITSSKDFLNSTAPINMNQINKMYREETVQMGFSDAVNSTQNLKRMTSKDPQQQYQEDQSSYYSGILGNTLKTTGGNNSKYSVSPMKAAKKQLLIQSILNQDTKAKKASGQKYPTQNSKNFLNLTLQQLIQQQHQDNLVEQQQQMMMQQQVAKQTKEIQSQIKQKNKRLNKTLDSGNQENSNNTYSSYDYMGMGGGTVVGDNSSSNSQVKLRSKLTQMNVQNTLTQQAKHSMNAKTLQQKKKFSSTMRISDFNQTQIFDTKNISGLGQIQQIEPGRKSKNSLKSTQNLNFQDESNPRKNSAMSTYSMNTALTTTTHLAKNKKIINNRDGVNLSHLGDQTQNLKHRRKGSQDKEYIKKILNFYQDDLLQQFQTQDLKPSKTTAVGKVVNIYKNQAQTKHKAHSTLNQYLQLTQQNLNDKTEPQLSSQTPNPYSITKKACLKKDHLKELQNKTQPIPKTLLEIAAQHHGAVNLSTGTSIIGAPIQIVKIASKDSTGQQQQRQGSQKSRTSKSRTKNQKVESEVKQEEVQAINKPKVGKRKDPEIAINHQKNEQIDQELQVKEMKIDDPVQIYGNKNTILIDGMETSCQPEDGEQGFKLERFTLGKQIGQGAYAVVRIAINKKENKKYAIKIYDKSKLTDTNRQRSVRREIKLLQKMNHTNIVKIFEAFETEHHVYLVMEYVAGGSLHSYLKDQPNRRLDEEEAKRIFKQMMTALQYCHRKSIAHRDIKLENILLDENKNVKLIDFGFSTCIPNDKKIKMFCGTPSYMAPEIVMKEEYAGPPADIWASAVLLYALMNGCFPFRGATDKELYRRIQRGTFVLHNQKLSDEFIELLTKMLNTVAEDRPTSESILSDQWFLVDSKSTEKNHEESIADQKRIFKAKILGKIPVEKTKNTICLNSSQEQIRNIQFRGGNTNINLGNINNNFQVGQAASNGVANQNINDFSDYGLQQQNVMRKLNQEAYQAYYNTSGCMQNNQNNQTQHNPYYNNFFQANNIQNSAAQMSGGGYHPQPFNNYQQQNRGSPGAKSNPIHNTAFPLNINQAGTPQVFGSPTAAAPVITNNTYNIIKPIYQVNYDNMMIGLSLNFPNMSNEGDKEGNIGLIQNLLIAQAAQQQQQQQKTQQTQQNINEQQQKVKPCQDETRQNNTNDQPQKKLQIVTDIDEDIISSITKMGYHRSHVVSQLESDSSHISHIYTKLKEKKLSQTQNRPLSLQPQRRINIISKGGATLHNNAIFPNFVPSIPDSLKNYGEDTNNLQRFDKTASNPLNNYYEMNDYMSQSPRMQFQQQRNQQASPPLMC